MRRRRSPLRLAAAAGLFGLCLVAACSGVLGIEERTFDADAAAGGLSCASYCDTAMAACTGAHQLYASNEVCLAVCAKLPLGTVDDATGNTVGCRLTHAKKAADLGPDGVDDNCPGAGPGGGGVCGSDCEGYCALMPSICPDVFEDQPSCLTACEGVPSVGFYSILAPNEDSIQCRLYHLTSASLDNTHCAHADGTVKCHAITDAGGD